MQTLMFEVVKTKNATLLSLDTCLQLQLISVAEEVHLVDEQAEKKVEALIKEYEDVLNGSSRCIRHKYRQRYASSTESTSQGGVCAKRRFRKENRRTLETRGHRESSDSNCVDIKLYSS